MVKKLTVLLFVWLFAAGGAMAADAPAPAVPAAPAPPPIAPVGTAQPHQVSVSVKIVEFQTAKDVETGFSAYFKQRNDIRAWGRVSSGNGNVRSADITFPTGRPGSITVFLDQISNSYGDFEFVLQALVDQNRAFILSQPKAMVTVGSAVPTTIKTTQKLPYENTVVVGATAVQTTSFRETGVDLTVTAPAVVDDDGNFDTTGDTYIQLGVNAAVIEEGQRITVALADTSQTGILGQGSNAIQVPELVSRSVLTNVWVKHGQVLLLGGLYRNTKNKSVSTLPWLTQGEDVLMGLAESAIPGASGIGAPLTTSLGNRNVQEGRRELVFLIKAELWKPAYTVATGMGFEPAEGAEEGQKKSLTGVFQEISEIPQGIVEGIKREDSSSSSENVQEHLGGK